ncbi:Cgr1 [Ophiocordyceps sinensis CO18]|uniref:rRNA-processing protein n=1 Tax=Ophiocordyceps sinensis (strain Co18 / CGMCC 3.14243) TaxID=911162 RepID=T5A9G0_OPHSC|nr:Cgr1 [Ophiocordyceps sinensis CO18]
MATVNALVAESAAKPTKPLGMRKNGKQWHEPKKAFRPTAGLTSYEKRTKERAAMAQMKAKEREIKAEKEAHRQGSRSRQQRIDTIREKRAKKVERERYEKMAETMHRKRVERLKRKEKRNKLLNS